MEENKETADDTSDHYGSIKESVKRCTKREKAGSMIDDIVIKATERFVEEIRQSSIYQEYEFQKEKLKKQPELFQQAKEFRQKNYALQNSAQGDELLEKLEEFAKEYEKFRENPLVDDFLRAELAFCRMMQEVNVRITAELDFE